MDAFESNLNDVLVDTFNLILKYEELSLKKAINAPITISEAHIIEAVGKQSGKEATVSELASFLNISSPTVTVAVKKLEQKGFIKKTPCEKDGRRTIISLTDMGGRIERIHRLFHVKMVKKLSDRFPEEEKEVLLRAINTLRDFFKVKVEAKA